MSDADIAQKKSGRGVSLRNHPLNREIVAVLLLAVGFFVSARLSPYFLDAHYLLCATSDYIEMALLALPLTFIIISGNIDISVASTLALSACAMSVLQARFHVPLPAAIALGLLIGAGLGLFNGLLIVRLKLPSLAVTLGTFALYRGLAQVLLGDTSVSDFPDWFKGIDAQYVGPLPVPLIVFLVLAVVFGLLLHRTVFGRWVYAAGTNAEASRYSGVPVNFTLLTLFTLSGLTAALGGLLMVSRQGAAHYDMGQGLELGAITAVVLGGTDIFGGRGTLFGTAIALALVAELRTGMGLAQQSEQSQQVVIGLLLIGSILLGNALQRSKTPHKA